MAQNIRVLVRMRPLLPFQSDPSWLLNGNTLHTIAPSNQSARLAHSRKDIQYQFHFESVIGESVTSEQLYKREIKIQLLENVRLGRNVSIMAYGQTCSGKTHSILGVKDAPGIIPCVLRDLFLFKQDRKCSLKLSYIEIYNEKVTDLLDSRQKTIKIVQYTSGSGFQLSGTLKESISSFEDSLKVLQRGQKRRQYGQGEHHDRSSRSHTLLTISVDQWDESFSVKSYVISIVDLAGSERLTHDRQSSQEAGYINKSLFQLTNCISKLAEKAPHIPFRDSKLTKLLEPSLTGSGRSFIICCISPSKSCFPETLSTLRLAERAKKIQLKEPQIEYSSNSEIQRLREKLQKKKRECRNLKQEVQELNQRVVLLEHQIKRLNNNQTNKKAQIPTNLLILLDHQNFTFFVQDHIQDNFSTSRQFQSLKDNFVEKLQALYEAYIKQVTKHCFGSQFELQIEEVCFINMVLQHQKIAEYKIQVIDQLLRQQNTSEDQGALTFCKSLELYQKKLKQQCNYSSQISSYRSHRSQDSSGFLATVEIENINMSNHSIRSSVKANNKMKKEVFGKEILVWGCKKDYRVCKGQTNEVGMVRINNLGKVRSVVCGYHHTLVVTQQGKLFGWGKNTQKQIINSQRDSISTPVLIASISQVHSVAAGWGHSLALTHEGKVYSWGYGKDGQLGHTHQEKYIHPTQIEHEGQIISIYAGHSHSAFLDSTGDLYTFGYNQDYRLMIGDQKQVLEPRRVSIRDVVDVALGVTHSAIITSNGSVFAGGTGRHGELGIQLTQSMTGWEKLQAVERKFQEENFQKICPMIQIEGFGRQRKAKTVKCGQNMTIVLTQLGEVFTFGKQLTHRLGHTKPHPTKILQGITVIESGSRNGFALNQYENKLYSWGFNMYGQTNPKMNGDLAAPELIQNLPQCKIIGISSGFFHSVLLLQ